jgi:hypothetical protein
LIRFCPKSHYCLPNRLHTTHFIMRATLRLSLLSVQSVLLLSACLLLLRLGVVTSAFSPLGHHTFHQLLFIQQRQQQQQQRQQKSPTSSSSRVVSLHGSISGDEINKRLEAQLTKLRSKDRASKPLKPEVRVVDFFKAQDAWKS